MLRNEAVEPDMNKKTLFGKYILQTSRTGRLAWIGRQSRSSSIGDSTSALATELHVYRAFKM